MCGVMHAAVMFYLLNLQVLGIVKGTFITRLRCLCAMDFRRAVYNGFMSSEITFYADK